MKFIVGLGNPGQKYKDNRHNVGHMVIDYLKDQRSKIKAVKTDCYMNESGKFVKKTIKLKIENLIVVHDDLDIPFGKFRIDLGRGPKLHNGLESIQNALGTKDFWRIRIGVDNRQKTGPMDGESYVLKDFLKEEKELLSNSIFPKILSRLNTDFSL